MRGAVLIPLAVGMLLAAESPATDALPPYMDWMLQGGGVGVLAFVVFWMLTRTIPGLTRDFRETLRETSDRHDAWERQRHEDSDKLNTTMRDMMQNCAKAQERMDTRK